MGDRAVEDRLAVFRLADLQEGGVEGRLDGVAGGIDLIEPHRRRPDLPAEQHGDLEGHLALFHLDPVGGIDVADGAADELGRLEHAGDGEKRLELAGFRILDSLGQQRQDGLATERLPAVAKVTMRSPGVSNRCSLRKVAMLSTPALVRVSAIMTRPSRTRMPTQYVMGVPPGAFWSSCCVVEAILTPVLDGRLRSSNERRALHG